jgi:hypothetical protein
MTFGGYLDRAPKGFIAKQMAKRNAGDWRDPEQVTEWVHHICHHMRVFAAVPEQRTEAEVVVPSGTRSTKPAPA